MSIFGENLANCQAEVERFPLPTSLCDSSVTFNGAPAGYFFANPTQINVLAPAALVPRAEVEVVVARNGMRSDPERIASEAIDAVAPAIFSYALEDGKPRAIIHNSDSSLNGPANPAAFIRPLKAGETAVVYVNGLGATTPPVPDREPAPVDPPARAAAPLDVWINEVSQRVLFAGLVPQLAGFYQVNFVLDPGTPIDPNDGNQIAIAAAGQRSPSLAISLAPAELATSQ